MSKVVRFNPTTRLKEWRERGRPTLNVGGGSTPVGLLASLAASPLSVTPSATSTLTTTVSGGSAPYAYAYTAPAGVTLTGTGASRTFSTATVGSYEVTVTVTDAAGATAQARATVTVAATAASLHAGHVPNRVLIGFAASETYDPLFPKAYELFKGGDTTRRIYERRIFVSQNVGRAALLSMLADCDADGLLPWVSFKHSNFADFYEGRMDASLDIIATVAKERGPSKPFLCTIYHEPAGDPGIVLSEWSKMQVYCSDYLAGWKPSGTLGTGPLVYSASRDVKDTCAWSAIMNGNKWGPNRVSNTEINDAYPQHLIDRFRENRSVLACDTYDGSPADPLAPNTAHVSSPDGAFNYPAGADRTSEKMQAFITWCKARNCGALGFAEFSTTEAAELTNCWKVLRANRDRVTVANYFNSGANSKWEWRIIPASYPQSTRHRVEFTDYWRGTWGPVDVPSPTHNGWREVGGTKYTEEQLVAFRTVVTESVSATWTAPV